LELATRNRNQHHHDDEDNTNGADCEESTSTGSPSGHIPTSVLSTQSSSTSTTAYQYAAQIAAAASTTFVEAVSVTSSVASAAVSAAAAAAAVAVAATTTTTTTTTAATNALPTQITTSPPTVAAIDSSTSSSLSSSSSSVQFLYELVFAMWCMALDCVDGGGDGRSGEDHEDDDNERRRRRVRRRKRHFLRDGAIPALVQMLKMTTTTREKIVRLSVSTLTVLATLRDDGPSPNDDVDDTDTPSTSKSSASSSVFVREMIGCGILKPLESLYQSRRYNDVDLQDDLDKLYDIVQRSARRMSQWGIYQADVESGTLRWGAHTIHTSQFFRDNVRYMEGPHGDFEPLQKLVRILYRYTNNHGSNGIHNFVGLNEVGIGIQYSAMTWDDDVVNDDDICETIAVALYDVGEFIRQYPNGRALIVAMSRIQRTYRYYATTNDDDKNMLGHIKPLVMQYMRFPRGEVQEQALSCSSKLLVQNWKGLGSITNEKHVVRNHQ
jgi:V-type H+-transporting ATPase subunit H